MPPSEVEFWDEWIAKSGHRWPEDFNRRTNSQAPLTPIMLNLLGMLEADTGRRLQILDIGSGPLSYVGYTHDVYDTQLTVVDPLAAEYNRLLDQVNVKDVPRP